MSKTEAAAEFRIRPADVGDVAFVCATWKNSHWRESPWASRLRWAVYAPQHERVIRRLLSRSSVLVACDPTDEAEILGDLVFEPSVPAVHFAYVKPAFRRAGVATALVKASGLPEGLAGVRITHATRAWFSAPPLVKDGVTVRPARPGIEDLCPGSIHDPYPWIIEEK